MARVPSLFEQHECVTIRYFDINHRDPVAVRLRTDHDTAGSFLYLRHAADMVVVVMRGEYMRQVPAKHVECFQDGRRVRRIDDGCIAGRAFAQQINVVVGPCRNLVDLEHRHLSGPFRG